VTTTFTDSLVRAEQATALPAHGEMDLPQALTEMDRRHCDAYQCRQQMALITRILIALGVLLGVLALWL
jgi:Tfp pilus assembly pilus retraction ATPase PilT